MKNIFVVLLLVMLSSAIYASDATLRMYKTSSGTYLGGDDLVVQFEIKITPDTPPGTYYVKGTTNGSRNAAGIAINHGGPSNPGYYLSGTSSLTWGQYFSGWFPSESTSGALTEGPHTRLVTVHTTDSLTAPQLEGVGEVVVNAVWSIRSSVPSPRPKHQVFKSFTFGVAAQNVDVDFEYAIANTGTAPGSVRLLIGGEVAQTIPVSAGATAVNKVTRSFAPGTAGAYEWQSLVDGVWVTVTGGEFRTAFGEIPALDPEKLILTLTANLPEEEPEEPEEPVKPPVGPTTEPPVVPPTEPTIVTTLSNGGGAAETREDMYDAVKAALKDAANESATPPIEGDIDRITVDEALDERGDIDKVKGKGEDVGNAVDDGISKLTGNLEAFSDQVHSMPVALGKVQSISFGSYSIAGQDVDLDVRLDKPAIAAARAALAACVYVAFFFITFTTIKGYF